MQWESMEEALARLYALMAGLPERPDALSDYGAENKIFRDRIAALRAAGEAYFVSFCDQHREGELYHLLEDAEALSIKRHRIAHGHITMWGEFRVPDGPGAFEVKSTMHYRWGAPW